MVSLQLFGVQLNGEMSTLSNHGSVTVHVEVSKREGALLANLVQILQRRR